LLLNKADSSTKGSDFQKYANQTLSGERSAFSEVKGIDAYSRLYQNIATHPIEESQNDIGNINITVVSPDRQNT